MENSLFYQGYGVEMVKAGLIKKKKKNRYIISFLFLEIAIKTLGSNRVGQVIINKSVFCLTNCILSEGIRAQHFVFFKNHNATFDSIAITCIDDNIQGIFCSVSPPKSYAILAMAFAEID